MRSCAAKSSKPSNTTKTTTQTSSKASLTLSFCRATKRSARQPCKVANTMTTMLLPARLRSSLVACASLRHLLRSDIHHNPRLPGARAVGRTVGSGVKSPLRSGNRAFIERAKRRSNAPLECEYCGRKVVINGSGQTSQKCGHSRVRAPLLKGGRLRS